MDRRQWKRQVLLVLSGVVIGALLVGTSIAVTSNRFRYSETKTGYLSLSHQDFADDGTDEFVRFFSGGVESEFTCFSTGVNLPQGARAKNITFYYTSPVEDDFYGDFTRQKMKALGAAEYPPYEEMAPNAVPVDDTEAPAAVTKSVNDDMELIDNQRYEYAVSACPQSGRFIGARIKYTYKTAGD